jgi:hypothetical protein
MSILHGTAKREGVNDKMVGSWYVRILCRNYRKGRTPMGLGMASNK